MPSLPFLPRWPVFGNLLVFQRDKLWLYAELHRRFGAIGGFHLGSQPVIMLYDPAYIHAVLSLADYDYCEKSPALRAILRPILGTGLLTTDSASHKRQRKLVAPAFHARCLDRYATIMVEYAQRWVDTLFTQDVVAIDVAMMELSFGIVGATLFGADLIHDATDIGTALTTVLHTTNVLINAPLPLPATWPLPRHRRFHQARARLDALIDRLIAERRAQPGDAPDVLSLLLAARDANGDQLTDQEIRDEVMTFILAGHETVAVALTWTWYLLAMAPAAMARLRDELDRVLGGRLPTRADLPQLVYLQCVVKESLRLYPPVHAIARQVTRPLMVGEHAVPAGTIVGISLYVVQRNPTVFPDPERFDPDRFAADASTTPPPAAYLPFSLGPRNCIGSQFAYLELVLVLATVAQRVTFTLVPGQQVEPVPLLTLRPRHPLLVRCAWRTPMGE